MKRKVGNSSKKLGYRTPTWFKEKTRKKLTKIKTLNYNWPVGC